MTNFSQKFAGKPLVFQRAYLGLPETYVKAGNWEKYGQTLTNFEFLWEKLNHPEFGLLALIQDYNLLEHPKILAEAEANPETVKALKLIQSALDMSGHLLAEDRTLLAGQLGGRLLGFNLPKIQALLAGALQWTDKLWLRPMTAS